MKELLIPSVIEIENVHGYCNAKCPMCLIGNGSYKDRSYIMSTDTFKKIIDKFIPYRQDIKNVEIVGLGESLVDKELCKKIHYLKKNNFQNVCIPINGGLLDEKKSQELLDAGLDTLLFSIDSIEKEVFEKIRKGLHFEKVIGNIKNFISLRNKNNYNTKVFVRIIIQEENKNEWEKYISFWEKVFSHEKGDLILKFPIHNWADSPTAIPKDMPCQYVYDRIIINTQGQVQFCCIDTEAQFYDLGNVLQSDPVELFNSKIFTHARDLMNNKRINELKYCAYCDVPIKRLERGAHIPNGIDSSNNNKNLLDKNDL